MIVLTAIWAQEIVKRKKSTDFYDAIYANNNSQLKIN